MKSIYAIVISPPENGEKFYNVYVPDLDLYTEGEDIEDAINMAKDCIGYWGIAQEDAHKEIPKGTTLRPTAGENDIVTQVEVDFELYREIPNEVTIAAMKEAEEMNKNPEAYKRYKSVKELMAALDEDED